MGLATPTNSQILASSTAEWLSVLNQRSPAEDSAGLSMLRLFWNSARGSSF
jgi:hypothetical protein